MSSLEHLEPLIAEKCAEMGFELFEARFFRAGSRSILRIFIDRPTGVTIADCEQVSNELSLFLDVENFINGRSYTLEVSSPGIDRPLKKERDFRRACGREVTVYLRKPYNGKMQVKGIIERCEQDVLCLSCNGRAVELPLAAINSGKEEIRFNHYGKE
ncbi:MAG: ribosome maturation factor RimP [Chitinispirillaceae bacterium]|nr:ribosome maturation factor RimP [Chitinispirillaceae bacterium]